MAEMEGTTKVVKLPYIEQDTRVDYSLKVTDYNAAGAKEELSVPVPKDERWGSIMLRTAILKRTTWKNFDVPTIMHATVYADQMGLDIMAGDVYMAEEGRISTTAGAKIRHAMASGRIVGYSVDIEEGKEISIDYQLKGQACKWTGPDLKATVTVRVKDWAEPVVYKTSLAEWFVGRNPNWRTRPAYMLRRNALSKALEEVAPMGVEPEEAPPVEVLAQAK